MCSHMGHLIEIAKPGRFIATNGKTYEFSEADLKGIAANYSCETHEAPLVVGHPKQDSPAYGWVKGLKVIDGRLCALGDQVTPEFSEMIRSAFKKRSASFYGPDHPNNPKPGQFYLRHVGFLGAAPPAIKGLKDVSEVAAFSEEEAAEEGELAAIEFGDWNDRQIARMFRGLRDFLIGEFGQEKADLALPAWNVDEVQEEAAQPDAATAASFGEGGDEDEPEPLAAAESDITTDDNSVSEEPAEFAEKRAALDAREAELLRRESEARQNEYVAFCEGIQKSGRPLPVAMDSVVGLMQALDGSTDLELVSFGEGDERSPLEVFRELLSNLPKTVDFSEHSPGNVATGDKDLSAQVRQVIKEHEARGEYISPTDALDQLNSEN